MKATWNTGCLYTRAGQRIGAEVIVTQEQSGCIVIFTDIDRGVDGEFPLARVPADADKLRALVSAHYDYHDYTFCRDYEKMRSLARWTMTEAPLRTSPNWTVVKEGWGS